MKESFLSLFIKNLILPFCRLIGSDLKLRLRDLNLHAHTKFCCRLLNKNVTNDIFYKKSNIFGFIYEQ